jgi:predicted DNA-binding transcriptional regulator AlpA
MNSPPPFEQAQALAQETYADDAVRGTAFALALQLSRIAAKSRDSFVFLDDVCALTGLPDTMVRGLVARGEFPEPVRLDGRRISFVLGEVLDWLAAVKTEKRGREMRPDLQDAARRAGAVRGEALRHTEGEKA